MAFHCVGCAKTNSLVKKCIEAAGWSRNLLLRFTPRTPLFTLYTPQLHSALSLHTLRFRPSTFTLHASHSTVDTAHFTLRAPDFALHTLHFAAHTAVAPTTVSKALALLQRKMYKTVSRPSFPEVFYMTAFWFWGCIFAEG